LGITVTKRFNKTLNMTGYMLIDTKTSAVVDGASPLPYSLTLDETEKSIDDLKRIEP